MGCRVSKGKQRTRFASKNGEFACETLGTKLTYVNFCAVEQEAARFRTRAKECRDRASTADFVMRQYLLQVADDLEAEANKIEVDEAATQSSSDDQSAR